MKFNNININTFNDWALQDKDKGMELGHASSVSKMFDLIKEDSHIFDSSFKALDLGCGNGWVVRKFLDIENCKGAMGIDGAPAMVKKAKEIDSRGFYINTDIEKWTCEKKFDIVFSMETFYYFDNVDKVLSNIYNNIISSRGILIIGIDHYFENTSSLNWDKEFNLKLNTLSINDWINKIKNIGFKNIQHTLHGSKKNWHGTLILYAYKT